MLAAIIAVLENLLRMINKDSSYRSLRSEAQTQGIKDATKLRKTDLQNRLRMNTKQNTILLVEEDLKYVLLVQRAVHKANLSASVQVVGDVQTALHYLSGQNDFADRERYPLPVLIVTNIKLPDRPGFDLLTWVRQQPKFKSLPVVVLSSSGEPGECDKAKDLCASAYFVKPLPLNDLVDKLENIMSHWATLQEWRTWNWR